LLADEHGQWMPWLEENFDLSYRTAMNYCHAAEYVARNKLATVANFANVSPSVLYYLADGDRYNEQEEAAILAQAKAGRRIDQDRAADICAALELPEDEASDTPKSDDDTEPPPRPCSDEDIKRILDGPPRPFPRKTEAAPSRSPPR
jgi:hypothetical protein